MKIGVVNPRSHVMGMWMMCCCMAGLSLGAVAQEPMDKNRLPNSRYQEKWEEYVHKYSKGGYNDLLTEHYFKQTVSVDEMVAAFHANKDKKFTTSPYAGHDSVVYALYSEQVLLTSPISRHPEKKVRECRGVWTDGKLGYTLKAVQGKDGKTDEALTEKVKKTTSLEWREGDFVALRKPVHYMGFIVSPRVQLESYNKERLVGYENRFRNKADYFSHAAPSWTIDGDWDSEIPWGALLLGKMICLDRTSRYVGPERTFSVLLYQKPDSKAYKREYTLQLLLPENPDKETAELFRQMKIFVEKLRINAFNPLYTTDFRIMTGRYYRVTVNKCGWLVEDYMAINR